MSTVVMIQNNFWNKKEVSNPYPPIVPSDLANLNQWYTPATITTANPTSWTDESGGTSHNLSILIGTATTGSLNGYKTMIINTSTNMQAQQNYTTVDSQPNQTFAVVVKPVYNQVFFDYGSVSNKIINMAMSASSTTVMSIAIRDENGIIIYADAPFVTGSYNILIGVYDGTNKRVSLYGPLGQYSTGSNSSYINTTTWEGTFSSVAYQSWASIGTTTYNQHLGWMEYAEIINYQETKSIAEVNGLANYLSTKYELSWTNF